MSVFTYPGQQTFTSTLLPSGRPARSHAKMRLYAATPTLQKSNVQSRRRSSFTDGKFRKPAAAYGAQIWFSRRPHETSWSRQDWTKTTTLERLADVFHSVRSSLQNFKKCRRLGTSLLPWGLVCCERGEQTEHLLGDPVHAGWPALLLVCSSFDLQAR
jgi:hypothetical protein